jgi:hypothetical protein
MSVAKKWLFARSVVIYNNRRAPRRGLQLYRIESDWIVVVVEFAVWWPFCSEIPSIECPSVRMGTSLEGLSCDRVVISPVAVRT